MEPDMAEVAKDYARRGLRIIPLQTPNPDGTCSCGIQGCQRVGKHPRWDENDLPNGVKSATTKIPQIDRWWKRWPKANIGIATGAGITVVDIDGEEGKNSAEKFIPGGWENSTLSSESGTGGVHLYFKNTGEALPNAVKFAPGLDIRDSGGYVVAPPSLHRNGKRYFWRCRKALQDLPQQIRTTVVTARKPALTQEDWQKPLYVSERESHITRLVGKMIGQGTPAPEVETMVYAWNLEHCKPPHNRELIHKIVASITRSEMTKSAQKPQENGSKKESENSSQIDPTKPLKTLTHREMLQKFGQHEIEWLVEDWLPVAACGLAVAPPESYKTWDMIDLAIALAKNIKFLGQFSTLRAGPVIVAQQEDSPSMLMERAGSIENIEPPQWSEESDPEIIFPSINPDLDIHWHIDRQLHFADMNSIYALEETIKKLKPLLVIIDPLYSAISSKDFGADAAQQMLYLKTIRDRYNCSFLLAHHTTKKFGMGGRERDDMWGSQFLNAWLEFGWQIRPEGKHSVTILRHFKNSPKANLIKLLYKITTWTYEVEIQDIEDDEEFELPGVSANGHGPQGGVKKKFNDPADPKKGE